jgi:hypothetical protein
LPDRQAVEMLKYHAGWNFALNRQVGDGLFHPTTLVNFRQRLVAHDLSSLGFTAILDALIAAGLVARQSRQRLDSTQMFGRVSRMNRLDCVRESLRLALEELAVALEASARPEWWPRLWERYVESQADYRASLESLTRKLVEAGSDTQTLLTWLAQAQDPSWAQGAQVQLLARVFREQSFANNLTSRTVEVQSKLGIELSPSKQKPIPMFRWRLSQELAETVVVTMVNYNARRVADVANSTNVVSEIPSRAGAWPVACQHFVDMVSVTRGGLGEAARGG